MKIYHWFIPNRKNNFHPLALRVSGLTVFLLILMVMPFSYNLTTANQIKVLGYATNISISDVNNISNQQRINAGLEPLNLNSTLGNAANTKAKDMFRDNYWAHVAPDGTTPWSFVESAGYSYSEAGENLAKNFDTSSGVVNGWMNSPTHAANVLKSSYTDVGYAVVSGVLLGEETTLVVAMYGAPALPVTVAMSSKPSTKTSTDNTKITIENSPSTITSKNQSILERDTGVVDGIMAFAPVELYSAFNWGQKASLLLLCTMMLLFIMKHTAIWREQKRGLRDIWLRAHPLGQTVVLLFAIIITLTSGVGVIL